MWICVYSDSSLENEPYIQYHLQLAFQICVRPNYLKYIARARTPNIIQ